MQLLPKQTWKKILVIFAYVSISIIILYFIFKYLIRYTLPFIISFFIALYTRPVYVYLTRKRVGKKTSSFIITSAVYLGIGSGTLLIIRKLLLQLKDIAERIISDPEIIFRPFENIYQTVYDKFPKAAEIIERSEFIPKLSSKVGELAIEIGEKTAILATKLPDILLFFFVLILSTYYLINCFDDIIKFAKTKIPLKLSCVFLAGKRHLIICSKKYVLCLLIMFAITFTELIIGFYILKIPYSFFLAVLIAVIDMLPILGVGAVLLPWAAISVASGEISRAVGILIMYIIITIVRQIAEPKIMGKSMGVSPLITLVTMYVGYIALGITGVILAPLVVGIISSLIHEAFDLIDENRVDKNEGL